MSISNNTAATSPQSGKRHTGNGKNCPRCKRFGTFAPHSVICDRCAGTLPLIFTVTVTVVAGDAR
jgi:hypothetical protein